MRNSALIATMAIHAPARNFVISTTNNTAPVDSKPTVLTTRERIICAPHRGSVSARSNRV